MDVGKHIDPMSNALGCGYECARRARRCKGRPRVSPSSAGGLLGREHGVTQTVFAAVKGKNSALVAEQVHEGQ